MQPHGGSRFAVIDKMGFSRCETNEHETTASDIARLRVCHGKSEPDSDGCIHRIAATSEHVGTHNRGDRISRDDEGTVDIDVLPRL